MAEKNKPIDGAVAQTQEELANAAEMLASAKRAQRLAGELTGAPSAEKGGPEQTNQLREQLAQKESALETVNQAIAAGANRTVRKERLTKEIEDLRQQIFQAETGKGASPITEPKEKKHIAKSLGLREGADWPEIQEANRKKFLKDNNISEDLTWKQIEEYKKNQVGAGSQKSNAKIETKLEKGPDTVEELVPPSDEEMEKLEKKFEAEDFKKAQAEEIVKKDEEIAKLKKQLLEPEKKPADEALTPGVEIIEKRPGKLSKYESLLEQKDKYERLLEDGGEEVNWKKHQKKLNEINGKIEKYDRAARYTQEDYIGSKEYYEDEKRKTQNALQQETFGKNGSRIKNPNRQSIDRMEAEVDRLEEKANPSMWNPLNWGATKLVTGGIKAFARKFPALGIISGVGSYYAAKEIQARDENNETQSIGVRLFRWAVGASERATDAMDNFRGVTGKRYKVKEGPGKRVDVDVKVESEKETEVMDLAHQKMSEFFDGGNIKNENVQSFHEELKTFVNDNISDQELAKTLRIKLGKEINQKLAKYRLAHKKKAEKEKPTAIDWSDFEGPGWRGVAFNLRQLENVWNNKGKVSQEAIDAIKGLGFINQAKEMLGDKLINDPKTKDLPWAISLVRQLDLEVENTDFLPKETLEGAPTDKDYEKVKEQIAVISEGTFARYREDLLKIKNEMPHERFEESENENRATEKEPKQIVKRDAKKINTEAETKARRGARKELRKESNIDELLKRQNEAVVECEVFIDRTIEQAPLEADSATLRADLLRWIDVFGKDYDFREEQREYLEKQIDSYLEKRNKLEAFWNEYGGDNARLIKVLVNKELSDDQLQLIAVNRDARGIAIEANQDVMNLLHQKGDVDTDSKKRGGFASYNKTHSVHYTVVESHRAILERITKERASNDKKLLSKKQLKQIEKDAKNIQLHELEHVKSSQKSVARNEELEAQSKDFLLQYKALEDGAEEKERKLSDYLETEQKIALNKVKREIVSSFHNDGLDGLKEKLEQKFLRGEESRYDYFDKLRESGVAGKHLEEGSEFLNKYHDTVEASVAALSRLVNKEEDGYEVEKAIVFLTNKDFEFWPQAVERMLEGKGKGIDLYKKSKKEKASEDKSTKKEKVETGRNEAEDEAGYKKYELVTLKSELRDLEEELEKREKVSYYNLKKYIKNTPKLRDEIDGKKVKIAKL
ncbi:MAG: hypothetical protein EXS48_02560 [Candidatus Staskawiczbacteria bacterium]|nr:hypothetical protein [Candidatus Staskawiczbacteria bacterium]